MNLSDDKQPPTGRKNAGAVPVWGPAHAAPAHPHYQVGAVGFGPNWDDDEDTVQLTWHGWKRVSDSMAASIVRLEQENDELRAEVAMLREEQKILRAETIVEELDNEYLRGRLDEWRECAEKLALQMQRLADCDWKITLPDRMDAVRDIARTALKEFAGVIEGGTNAAVPLPSGEHGRPSDLSPRTNVTEVRGVPIEELREDFLSKWRRDK